MNAFAATVEMILYRAAASLEDVVELYPGDLKALVVIALLWPVMIATGGFQ